MARAVLSDPDDISGLDEEFELSLAGAEVIESKIDLRKKTKPATRKPKDKDPVKAAEEAMEKLSQSFAQWMSDEIDALQKAWSSAGGDGLSDDSRDQLFRVAHDIKGQAATFGFPFAGNVAGSLCRLLLEGPGAKNMPMTLLDQHVQAIRAIVREDAREENNRTARRLVERLREVTDEYIATLKAAA